MSATDKDLATPVTSATPATEPAASPDSSDQDVKSGKCTSNDINCYLDEDYWKDMNAEAEGPLVDVIQKLPKDLRMLFQSEKEVVNETLTVSGLEWTKVDGDFETSDYTELDDSELEQEMIKLSATNKEEIVFSEEKFKEIALEDEITAKTFVTLDNGDMYIPRATVSDKMSTETVINVMDVATFIGISLLVVLVFVMFLSKITRKEEPKPQWGMPPPWMMRT
jgi:hypothetical protein